MQNLCRFGVSGLELRGRYDINCRLFTITHDAAGFDTIAFPIAMHMESFAADDDEFAINSTVDNEFNGLYANKDPCNK